MEKAVDQVKLFSVDGARVAYVSHVRFRENGEIDSVTARVESICPPVSAPGAPIAISGNEIFRDSDNVCSGWRLSDPFGVLSAKEGRNSLLDQKLESIISGYKINRDDADWLRALVS